MEEDRRRRRSSRRIKSLLVEEDIGEGQSRLVDLQALLHFHAKA
jgi:hypothetical protein